MRLSLIYFLTLISVQSFGQTEGPCGAKVFNVTDTLPKLIPSGQYIADYMARQIDVSDTLLDRRGRVDVQYVINCRGESVKCKVLTIYDYDKKPIQNDFNVLGQQIISILKSEISWRPARQGGKNVDFYQILAVEFRQGLVRINLEGTWFFSKMKTKGN